MKRTNALAVSINDFCRLDEFQEGSWSFHANFYIRKYTGVWGDSLAL
jgi:hypothetical protein